MHTTRETSHSTIQSGHLVVMDLSHLDQTHFDLFYSWVEIWLYRNCKSAWHIVMADKTDDLLDPHHYLKVEFEDAREAIYFKLSPEFIANTSTENRKLRDWLTSQAFLSKICQ